MSIRESAIVRAWQRLGQAELVTEDGAPVSIVYPGRPNYDRGADLLDAVIQTSQGMVRGDIEVHVKSSEWQAHHHHDDPGYNNVILHVVMRRDTEVFTVLQNQNRVSILALEKYFYRQPVISENFSAVVPCQSISVKGRPGAIIEVLERAGEVRFRGKASGFQAQLAQQAPAQVLYEGVMGALGYSKNKLPFQELARRLPLQILVGLSQEWSSDTEALARLQTQLFGMAGLLPSQRSFTDGENYVDRLERLWAASLRREAMSVSNWDFGRLRPNNSPARRLAAMSYLIRRYRTGGMLEEFIGKITDAPAGSIHRELEDELMVRDYGYWENHFDFGLEMAANPALIGVERAADIVVNVVLPFVYACGQPAISRKAREIYRHYPRLAANALERHMTGQLGLGACLLNSACRQQGLIHVYRTLCSQGECRACPLANV